MGDPLIVSVIRKYHPGWGWPQTMNRAWTPCRCPFHDDTTASASVSYEYNAFVCHACPVRGSAIELIKEQEGVPYAEAKRIAAEIAKASGGELPPEPARKPGGRASGEQGASVAVDPSRGTRKVQARLRGRASAWS